MICNGIHWQTIDTTNYSQITLFQNQFISTGSIRDNRRLAFSVDMNAGVVQRLPNMLYARCGHQTQVFQDRLYVLGGIFGDTTESGTVDQVESFDGNTWQRHTCMPFANFAFATAASDTNLFVLGGMLCDADGRCPNRATSRVWKYNPKTNTWMECARMLRERSHFAACFFQDFIYVFAKQNCNPYRLDYCSNWVECYNLHTDRWSKWKGSAPEVQNIGSLVYII